MSIPPPPINLNIPPPNLMPSSQSFNNLNNSNNQNNNNNNNNSSINKPQPLMSINLFGKTS